MSDTKLEITKIYNRDYEKNARVDFVCKNISKIVSLSLFVAIALLLCIFNMSVIVFSVATYIYLAIAIALVYFLPYRKTYVATNSLDWDATLIVSAKDSYVFSENDKESLYLVHNKKIMHENVTRTISNVQAARTYGINGYDYSIIDGPIDENRKNLSTMLFSQKFKNELENAITYGKNTVGDWEITPIKKLVRHFHFPCVHSVKFLTERGVKKTVYLPSNIVDKKELFKKMKAL